MITIDKYATLDLQEGTGKYEGTFSLFEGWVGRDGDFKKNWCKREFGKVNEKTEKDVPVSVKLGNRAKVIEVALWLLREMTGKEYGPIDDGEAPF